MRVFKKTFKWILYFLLIPISYILVSLILGAITIDRKVDHKVSDKSIFLSTNGVHLDIVIAKQDLDKSLLFGIKHKDSEKYLSFGWGDENFYINTPNWGDLTINTAFRAVFLKSSTLMHVTHYNQKQSNWVEVKLNVAELEQLNSYLLNSFVQDENGMKVLLEDKGYTSTDDFYKAKGSYSWYNTCNSWVNLGFKESGLKSSLWTPFDFGLLNKYK